MASSTTWSLNSSLYPQVTTLHPPSQAHCLLANRKSNKRTISSSNSMIFYLNNKNSNANRSIKTILQSTMCSLLPKKTRANKRFNSKLSNSINILINRVMYRSISSLCGRNSKVAQNHNYIPSKLSLSLSLCCRSTLKNCWPAIRLRLSKRQPLSLSSVSCSKFNLLVILQTPFILQLSPISRQLSNNSSNSLIRKMAGSLVS